MSSAGGSTRAPARRSGRGRCATRARSGSISPFSAPAPSTLDAGVAAFDAEEAEFKRLIAERAKAVAAAVTTDKLGTAAPFAVAPVSRLTHLVVEADAPEEALAPLRRAGVNVLRAERVGEATR